MSYKPKRAPIVFDAKQFAELEENVAALERERAQILRSFFRAKVEGNEREQLREEVKAQAQPVHDRLLVLQRKRADMLTVGVRERQRPALIADVQDTIAAGKAYVLPVSRDDFYQALFAKNAFNLAARREFFGNDGLRFAAARIRLCDGVVFAERQPDKALDAATLRVSVASHSTHEPLQTAWAIWVHGTFKGDEAPLQKSELS